MDLDPSTAIQHLLSKKEHEDRMRLTKAQEMAKLAEATRNKTKATYRYSLLAFIREIVEQRANDGLNDATFRSKSLPWTANELQAIVTFVENDGFTVSIEDEMERQYISMTGAGVVSGLGNPGELKPNGHKILTVTW